MKDEIKNIRIALNNINKDSTVIITSSSKNEMSFNLKPVYERTYRLYISDSVKSIERLFWKNRNIVKILFDNWNTSNLVNMDLAFSDMHLNKIDSFSYLDFSNLETAESLFLNTKINNDLYFMNKSLYKLKNVSNMFNKTKCYFLIVNLGSTIIDKANHMFDSANCDFLKFTLKDSDSFTFDYAFKNTKINYIDLKHFNIKKCIQFESLFSSGLIADEIVMPDTFPNKVNTDISLSPTINKIYCNREWSNFLTQN